MVVSITLSKYFFILGLLSIPLLIFFIGFWKACWIFKKPKCLHDKIEITIEYVNKDKDKETFKESEKESQSPE